STPSGSTARPTSGKNRRWTRCFQRAEVAALQPLPAEQFRVLGTKRAQTPPNPLKTWRARQESNLYQELRKLSFYPLNYGRRAVIVACLSRFICVPMNKASI